MATRTPEKQSAHDEIVRMVAAHVTNVARTVMANPGREKNDSVGGLYPDVVVRNRATGVVLALYEIETEDSVTADESEQWAAYAKLAPLTLVVPKAKRLDATVLLVARDTEVSWLEYTIVGKRVVFSSP